MSVLSAQNLGKSFGPVDIFEDLTFAIPRRARIAIVGPNGVGKTTLLRILAGVEEPTRGSVHRARGLTLGYLPQEAVTIREGTLWSYCLMAFEELLAQADELKALEREMQNPDCPPDVLQRYGTVLSRFEQGGGYTYANRIQQTLAGLGFLETDYQRPLTQLSGGQRTRAVLARLLLDEPDLLLLDEPSNHLDIAAVEWLEAWLRDWDGAVVIVSHDRYFLDQTATQVWEMTPALEVYRGNYTAYLTQREARYTRRLAEYEAQNEYIEKQEDYIRRFLGTQNNNQARGRQRRLERLLADSRLSAPKANIRPMHLRLALAGRSGDLVLRSYDLQVGYQDEGRPLFRAPDLVLKRGECVAIIGPNGAGKTTFLKTILNQIPPYAGRIELGASLKVGYFAQAHEGLNPELTLIEEINTVALAMLPAEARNYLAKYGFTGEEVFAAVSTLSGGERGRLALAKLALTDANLLLLDEPTNHLDLPTQEVLQNVLADYPGTILLVSHDRYLIDALATQIWEMDPDAGMLKVFSGTYSEYKIAQSAAVQPVPETAVPVPEPAAAQPEVAPAGRKTLSRNQRQQIQKKLDALEERIHALERESALHEAKLANPPADPVKTAHLAEAYNKLKEELEPLLAEWEALATSLEEDPQ
ncbi:MAG: ABC-F family ATP-binding cassette domain-containing protein [Chloroflexi bacterium]|jgi:ATP-binding cassette subfamily F protein 3|nr:ABC-F family ATP-binding cassette domain-containing protein [Anaerolineaceae bacterium]NLI44303.1 ABC-F family ATP-binding cassette domain-containing protein [Chloroflexota bacterium]HOE35776.1 ABC-F family ATP-binding cassette domain-containing protein [Anaerolineaceae bacterium]HQH57997.1 ABC-F family ATP-binding cassette domain-containing protein [Anaerolineaceae bacterium]HQK04158.1 ABC-F family ATP-binding cassette domain-containing protein [Anaerolineaceae bacterium]